MIELQVELDFACCNCGSDVSVTLKCAGKGLAGGPHQGVADVVADAGKIAEPDQLVAAHLWTIPTDLRMVRILLGQPHLQRHPRRERGDHVRGLPAVVRLGGQDGCQRLCGGIAGPLADGGGGGSSLGRDRCPADRGVVVDRPVAVGPVPSE